jgi:hypothetical protein
MAVGKGYDNGAEVNETMNSFVGPMGQIVSCKPEIGTRSRGLISEMAISDWNRTEPALTANDRTNAGKGNQS